jgi:hypothetical protein
MPTHSDLLRVANESGFPLQIAVQHAVTLSTNTHGWKVAHTEHAWTNNADGKSGFIDLVLQDRNNFASLVIECKRVRNTTWLFLNTEGSAGNRRHSKAWTNHYRNGGMNAFGWFDVPIDPATPEAQFCVLRGQSANDKNTFLERVAGELISSTEALALEERDYRQENVEHIHMYFNVVVTTAALAVAKFDPAHLSLADGTLAKAEFTEIPFVRVRKQFSLRPALLTPADWMRQDDPDYRRENTVFVVRADKLVDFLHMFDIPNSSLSQFQR